MRSSKQASVAVKSPFCSCYHCCANFFKMMMVSHHHGPRVVESGFRSNLFCGRTAAQQNFRRISSCKKKTVFWLLLSIKKADVAGVIYFMLIYLCYCSLSAFLRFFTVSIHSPSLSLLTKPLMFRLRNVYYFTTWLTGVP